MKTVKKLLILVVASILFQSCKMKEGCKDGTNGTLIKLNLDGCFWAIELENDQRIIPVNLDNFDIKKVNDVQFSISYTELNDIAGICMAGKMVELSCMTEIEN